MLQSLCVIFTPEKKKFFFLLFIHQIMVHSLTITVFASFRHCMHSLWYFEVFKDSILACRHIPSLSISPRGRVHTFLLFFFLSVCTDFSSQFSISYIYCTYKVKLSKKFLCKVLALSLNVSHHFSWLSSLYRCRWLALAKLIVVCLTILNSFKEKKPTNQTHTHKTRVYEPHLCSQYSTH